MEAMQPEPWSWQMAAGDATEMTHGRGFHGLRIQRLNYADDPKYGG